MDQYEPKVNQKLTKLLPILKPFLISKRTGPDQNKLKHELKIKHKMPGHEIKTTHCAWQIFGEGFFRLRHLQPHLAI